MVFLSIKNSLNQYNAFFFFFKKLIFIFIMLVLEIDLHLDYHKTSICLVDSSP